jgi:DNA-binding LytR/AlgR family response regulator
MRIAICDDKPIHRKKLRAALIASGALPEDVEILEYSNGTNLVESHMKRQHDIIFLDIEMDGISGLEAGQEIRKADRNVIIIILSGFKKYVFNSFLIEPFDYIIKPANNDTIEYVLTRAMRKYREQHHIVDFKWLDKAYVLKVCDIVHLESDIRQVQFVTRDNVYKSIGRLDDYERRLSPYGFLRCHKSFLINMGYIKSIESRSIETTLGSKVCMSTRRKQYCLNAFSEYIARYRV